MCRRSVLGPALLSSCVKRLCARALDSRVQPRVTARIHDTEMLQRLRSSLCRVLARGSAFGPPGLATRNSSPGLVGFAVRHVSPLRHAFPRARSFVMACLSRATAALARQVPAWARGVKAQHPLGDSPGSPWEGATRLSGSPQGATAH